jgi:tetratricopeptide (TPR) repeat protein
MAHALLGNSYANTMQPELSIPSLDTAYRLRNHATEHERFFIDFSYDIQVTGNLQKARETAELWSQAYPRDPSPHGLVPFVDQSLGKYEASIEESKKCLALNIDHVFGYNNIAWSYLFLNRPAEAEKTIQQATGRKLYNPEFLIIRYYAAFLRGDATGMASALQQGRDKSGVEDWMFQQESAVQAYSGRLDQARTMSRRAIELAMQTEQKDRAALYEAGAGVREAFFGNAQEAQHRAANALGISKSRDVEYGAGIALAISGEVPRAEALAGDLEKRFPEDTIAKFTYVPTLRAQLALTRKDPAKAIDLLKSTGPYDLAIPGSWSGFFGNLYSSYVRGEAFLANQQGAEAAAEFQGIIDHPGIVFADPVGPIARIGLGKAWALAGDKAKAKAAYQDFLTLWKGADQNVTVLNQVKAEYAGLTGLHTR